VAMSMEAPLDRSTSIMTAAYSADIWSKDLQRLYMRIQLSYGIHINGHGDYTMPRNKCNKFFGSNFIITSNIKKLTKHNYNIYLCVQHIQTFLKWPPFARYRASDASWNFCPCATPPPPTFDPTLRAAIASATKNFCGA
jgi:hypothetical protein